MPRVRKSIGEVTHYFPKVQAAVIRLQDLLKLGETILIEGPQGSLKQQVKSLQINHIPIDEGRQGEEVGLEVKKRVCVGDQVYRV